MRSTKIFSEEQWSEVAERYRRSSRARRALVWFYAFCAAVVTISATLAIIWVIVSALSHAPKVVSDDPQSSTADHGHAPAVEARAFDYEIENFNVSFGKNRNRRIAYAQFALVLRCKDHECLDWMKLHRASIRDAVFTLAMTEDAEQVSTKAGIEEFKRRVLAELQLRFKEKAPEAVLLRDWFIR